MEFELLGWPSDDPTLRLDHERFAYAGKFVMSTTGKAVARDGDEIVAAVAFNADRTDDATLWLRYVTVRTDRRGEGTGPRLVALVRNRALRRGYERVRIAVNNPYAYEALHRIGFEFTGETTGIAELVLEYADDGGEVRVGTASRADPERYVAGLRAFEERDLSGDEREFLEARVDRGPPPRLDVEDAT